MATQVSGVNTWLTLNGKPLRFNPGADNFEAEAMEYDRNFLVLNKNAPLDVRIYVDGEELPTTIYGRWLWRPAGFAGLYDVAVSVGRGPRRHTQVRVLPSHLSQKRHEAMLKQISQLSADLLFQLHSPAREWVSPDELEQIQSPLRTYKLIENLMDDLRRAMGQIARSPHRALVTEQIPRRWHEVAVFSGDVSPVPGSLVAMPYSRAGLPTVWPAEWVEERSTPTHDVYENRLLKHFLWRQLLPRLAEVETRAAAEIDQRQDEIYKARREGWKDEVETQAKRIAELEQVIAACQDMQRQVIGWGNLPFLKTVSVSPVRAMPTQVLQKQPAYNRFYSVYLRFQRELKRGLNTEGFLTTIAMRKMSELYETWAVLRLTAAALKVLRAAGYQPVSDQGFFRVDDEFFHFEVDRQADIVFARGNDQVKIRYEPLYPSGRTVADGLVTDRPTSRTPDMAIEFWESSRTPTVILFDPKYKTADDGPKQGPVQEDLDKMSRYYGEIAWKERGGRGRLPQVVSSAYILYPGNELVHDRLRPDIGALPMVPGSKASIEAAERVLKDLLDYAGIIAEETHG